MAQTFNSRRLRLIRQMDDRFAREHQALAAEIARLILSRSISQTDPLANRRALRETLKATIWSQVLKPYYVGPGDDAFRGPQPRSPFARLIREGVERNARIQAEAQVGFLRRHVRDDEVFNWLTGPRPALGPLSAPPRGTLRGYYDPFHRFVDPNGYRLSDRVWRDAVDVRSRVDRLLDTHISRGTAAVDIAEEAEAFLTPGAAVSRTRTPYGTEGSFAARRLARTEITAQAGRSTVNASLANPFVMGVQWSLSASHPCCDVCDDYASGGPAGDGIYIPQNVPTYPAHPHCMCNLSPVVVGSTADLVEELRADIRAARPEAQALRGFFNPDWQTQAQVVGFAREATEAVV